MQIYKQSDNKWKLLKKNIENSLQFCVISWEGALYNERFFCFEVVL